MTSAILDRVYGVYGFRNHKDDFFFIEKLLCWQQIPQSGSYLNKTAETVLNTLILTYTTKTGNKLRNKTSLFFFTFMQNNMQIAKPSSDLKTGLTINHNPSVVIFETNISAGDKNVRILIKQENEIVLKNM